MFNLDRLCHRSCQPAICLVRFGCCLSLGQANVNPPKDNPMNKLLAALVAAAFATAGAFAADKPAAASAAKADKPAAAASAAAKAEKPAAAASAAAKK